MHLITRSIVTAQSLRNAADARPSPASAYNHRPPHKHDPFIRTLANRLLPKLSK